MKKGVWEREEGEMKGLYVAKKRGKEREREVGRMERRRRERR